MPKKNEPSKKEIYRLWWEYLSRSKHYREFCDWTKKNIKDLMNADIRFKTTLPTLPRKFAREGEKEVSPIWYVHFTWGDPRDYTFEEWFQLQAYADPTIINFAQEIHWDMERVIETFTKENGRKPSLEEFKKGLSERLHSDPFHRYFRVNIYPKESIEDVGKEFCKILREARKGLKFNFPVFCSERWVTPTKPLHFEDVKGYLQVFDLRREGKKWREIVDELYPKYKLCKTEADFKKREYLERALYIDCSNAKKIIENVEEGSFPGKY